MILSDREIILALRRKAIQIDPCPTADSISSTAVDLCLDGELRRWERLERAGAETTFDPTRPDFNVTAAINEYSKLERCDGGFVLEPGMFVLGWTVEKIYLPHASRVAARVEGKSSLARIGVGVHVTAPTIHAGFGHSAKPGVSNGAPIQLEIWNPGSLRVKLTKGMPICQLILEEVHGTPDKGYGGQFNMQGPPVA